MDLIRAAFARPVVRSLLLWLTIAAAATPTTSPAQSLASLEVSITQSSGFWFPKQFHTLALRNNVVTLEFFIRDKQQFSSSATDADIAAIRVLLERSEFTTLNERYAREEDGCESIFADAGRLRIQLLQKDYAKTVTLYEGCHTRANSGPGTVRQLFQAIELILDRPQWRDLRRQEWNELIKMPKHERQKL